MRKLEICSFSLIKSEVTVWMGITLTKDKQNFSVSEDAKVARVLCVKIS